ncbi:ABC transporter permease [Acidisphaera sp. L21]|uniref:ABC transporter permease n=1 Tax=Acidisphaera sp. L21 TaxID=1641851 RepID=UPI0038CF5789
MRILAGTLGSVPVTLFGLVFITFLIGRVVPIDPVLAVVGDRAPQSVVEQARREMGLDRPLPVQFARYVGNLLHGDLGRSVMTSHSVISDIGTFFPATMELATLAILLATAVGIPLGVLAAVRRGSWADQAIRVGTLCGWSVPVFVLALLALLVFYATLGWSPGPGRQDVVFQDMDPTVTGFLTIDTALAGDWDAFRDALAHLILPSLVLAVTNLATIARMTRAFMLDALGSEYIVTARAKGLSAARVVWRHAFANIGVRLVTVLALTYAGLLEGAVLTETVFSWPGIGQYLTGSLLNADMNAVLGATLVIGLTYVLLNLLADLAYRVLDPRVR